MAQTNWEADKMLDVYIHDYLVKRELKVSAQAFQAEAKVSSDPVAIDAPGGFLFEWWSVFWDIFIARTNEKHSEVAASYIETQLIKAREQQQQQQQQQMQMQQLLLQRHAQQQQQQQSQQQQLREGNGPHHLNGPTNALIGTDPLTRQSSSAVSAMAAKVYEEKMKLPQRDALEDATLKQRFGENAGQLMDPTQPSMMKSAGPSSANSGQVLHGAAGSMSPQVQVRGQQQPGPLSDLKNDLNPVLNPRAIGPEGSLIVVPGANQGNNNLTLKGWPLTGLDQLRSGLLQQQNPFIQSPQPFHQLQMLTPQHQQQLLLAQRNLTIPSANDLESRRLRMLLNSQNMSLGKDSLSNSIGDVIPNMCSTMQVNSAGLPNMCSTMQVNSAGLPRGDPDMQLKLKMAQLQRQQQNNQQQHSLANQMWQNINHNLHQQDKVGGSGSGTPDGPLTNSYRANEQTSKSQTGRKRKQPSSGPANSTGTANTAGPSLSSAPSTPSTHTPGDVMSIPTLPHITSSSKPLMMFGTDGPGSLTFPSNQLWDDKDFESQADMDRFAEDAALDNVESFLSHDDTDPRDAVGRGMDVSKGFSFNEVCSILASPGKVICCHFSSDGKLLASGGHDKKAVLWHTDNLKDGMKLKATLEEHSSVITDVRFSPSMSRLATSSYDKTIRIWDADNAGYSLRNFSGHSGHVMSLDFHPNKDDLIASCDRDGEIRYWSIKDCSCVRVFKGGITRIRFRPRNGRLLAAAAENIVSVLDVETQAIRHSLQGHSEQIHSVCWSPSGDLLASVSNDSVRVWNINGDGECVHELSGGNNGNQFHSCVFHPTYPSLLVVGCFQSLELWNMTENKTMTLSAHEGVIASLTMSTATGLVASASHDKMVKLWN